MIYWEIQKNTMGKKYLLLNKVLDKIKESIRIYDEKYDDTKILIDTDDKLPDDITLKNVAILIKCIKKVIVNFIHKYFQRKPIKMLVDETSVVNKIAVVSKNLKFTSFIDFQL